jgi:hypothetical protein
LAFSILFGTVMTGAPGIVRHPAFEVQNATSANFTFACLQYIAQAGASRALTQSFTSTLRSTTTFFSSPLDRKGAFSSRIVRS